MAEHRVPMLGAALRRRRDPAHSRDLRVRRVVAALHDLDVAPAPRAEFRDELRAQLVAVAPRLVAEGKAELRTAGAADAGRSSRTAAAETAERPERHLKKPLLAVAGVLAAFVLLLGGAVLLSQHALPGDALYGLKRASENTEYSLAGGSIDRGKLKLQFAATRINEVEQLLGTPTALGPGVGTIADSGAISPSAAALVRQTLNSADNDVLTAAQLLTGSAVATRSTGPLAIITGWSPAQQRDLNRILARVHGTGLTPAVRHTGTLIAHMTARAQSLKTQLHCNCLDPARSDQFGPKPCRGACSAPKHKSAQKPGGGTGNSGSGSGKRAGSGPGGKSGGTPRSSGAPQPGPSGTAPRRGGSSSSAPGGGSSAISDSPAPSGSSPQLPVPSSALPSAPSATLPGSTCATLSLGPVEIGIGNC